jgi:hypothetical protein
MKININHPLYEEFTSVLCDFLVEYNQCRFEEMKFNCAGCMEKFLEEILSE